MKKLRIKNPNRQLWLIFSFCIFCILAITISIFLTTVLVLAQMGYLTDINSASQSLPIIFSAIASLPIGALLTMVLVHIPLKPVNRLANGMKRLAEGHFDERVELGNIRVYRELSESFNTLAQELEHTEMLRSDFINHFSHEFKTPIVSIRGFARILQRGGLSRKEEQEYLDIIVEESTRLSAMATNVLYLTKVENQSILTDLSEFNLSEQLRRCVLMLERKWTDKSLAVEAVFGEHMICANEALLKEVWLNLLDNAIKFSSASAGISVQIHPAGDSLSVTIANHGPMIPEDQKKRLFDKFWQGDASHASDGAGVGLSIVRQAVRLHKGSVEVQSSEEKTAFIVTLPRKQEAE